MKKCILCGNPAIPPLELCGPCATGEANTLGGSLGSLPRRPGPSRPPAPGRPVPRPGPLPGAPAGGLPPRWDRLPKKPHRDKIRARLAVAQELLLGDRKRTHEMLKRIDPALGVAVHERLVQLEALLARDVPALLDYLDTLARGGHDGDDDGAAAIGCGR